MNCELARKQLPLLVYGELGFDEEETLEQHLETCAGCRDELKVLETLHRLADEAAVELPPGMLEGCRGELRRRIGAEGRKRGADWWGLLWSWRPVAAMALVALGFFSARVSGPPEPFTGARVRHIEPEGSGQVRLVVEETRQRSLAGRMQDEPIRKLLLAAAADREDAGLRVESINLLNSQSASAEVRRALVLALRTDPNPGVRIKALEGLKSFAGEAETRRALTQALLTDEHAGVRTMAVDLLIAGRQQDLAGVLQQALRQENNDYIRERSARALREMRASIETF